MRQLANSQLIPSLFVFIHCVQFVTSSILWHTSKSVIGAENYTYFQISKPGSHRIDVVSLTGDADLYVSDKTTYPDFENYDLKSTTCGTDSVDVPSSFQRPLYIGIYGHPNYENSTFQLNIYHMIFEEENSYESYVQYNTRNKNTYSNNYNNDNDENESPWMTILIGILKIILDVLF
ncbi:hypothetical protein LOTGIDRAFT_129614 [Lottia gigantea]|uniref:CUB domain-containing protein n=1 Tax=Lottia gigantea TaxID=225164 RepID=V3ZUA5_LOTGI|nr:hypothetical protein LOTGIDRAFT_129614 [Lottia gigantea]ESO86165.1 hypothetical protein LOTGIDRAFT_129614 [Lottia gigantea]